MKVSPTSDTKGTRKTEVLLPLLEDQDLYKLDKTNSVSWDLLSDPADGNSPKYRYQVRILQGNETVRQMIRWRLDVIKVTEGLATTTLATRKPIMEACMRPGPLSQFKAALTAKATITYQEALRAAEAVDVTAGDTVASDRVKGLSTRAW